MDSLSGRHVLVIGGSRGIGAATAVLCAREGASVSIVYRKDAVAASKVVHEIERLGGRGLALQADVTDEAALANAVNTAAGELGPISGLVISAGIFEGAPIDVMTLQFWNKTLATNLTSTFLAVKHAVPHMRGTEGASIVIIASTAGQRGSGVFSAYATSKAGQVIFMRSMAKELAPSIRVNCVAPGWTDTDMADPSLTTLGREEVAREFPLGRIGLAEDVAKACLFLLSDLSGFVTGSTVTVDGGSDMRG